MTILIAIYYMANKPYILFEQHFIIYILIYSEYSILNTYEFQGKL